MKHLSKLKLNAIAESRLAEREMNALRGGDAWVCTCACEEDPSQHYVVDADIENNADNHIISDYPGYTYMTWVVTPDEPEP